MASDMLISMAEAAAIKSDVAIAENVSSRLKRGIVELQSLHDALVCGEGLDFRILTDFRDSVNRVLNTAWPAQQYLARKHR